MDIAWHEKCLINRFNSLERQQLELIAMETKFTKDVKEFNHYKNQICKAKSMSKDSFDSEKFMKKERP